MKSRLLGRVGAVASRADGFAERASTSHDYVRGSHVKKAGAGGAFDTLGFVSGCRVDKVTTHVARSDNRQGDSAIDGRISRHTSYQMCRIIRERVERHFALAELSAGSGRRSIAAPGTLTGTSG